MSIPLLRFGAGDGVNVDLERLYESRLLIQGVSGSGKSTLIRALLEQTHGKVPQFVIDSEGDFVTLREKYDYVLVGRGGDVPLSTKTAKTTIRRLAELHVSAIFDLSELRFPERREWVRIACEELIHLPRALWSPRLFILDEAHNFCPERGSGEAVSTSAVIDVGSLGRKRGICFIAATQRLSKLHKDLAGELLNKLIGYTDDVDLQRAGDQLGMTKEQRSGLKLLETHTFYAYGPAISRAPVLVRTAMPLTKPPPRGKDRPAAPPARDKLKKILAQLVDLPKEAEEEAKTMEELRRRNSDLERRIRQAEKGVATKTVEKPVRDEAAIERAVAAAVAAERKEWRSRTAGFVRTAQLVERKLSELAAPVGSLAAMGEGALANLPATPASVPPAARAVPAPRVPVAPAPRRPAAAAEYSSDVALSGTQRRILAALAQFAALGQEESSRPAVAGYCAISHTTGSFSNNLSALRTAGLIEDVADGKIRLTDEGHAAAGPVDTPVGLEELHRAWAGKLSGTQARMLDVIIASYPDAVSRQTIADTIGVQADTGSFSNNLSKLRTLGLIADKTRSDVVATELLFPPGLA